MELFRVGFLSVRLIDVLDVLLVAFIIYRLHKLFQRTIVVQLFVILMGMVFAWQVSEYLDLALLKTLLNQLVQIGAILVVVVFAPEIRRFLITLSQNSSLRALRKQFGGESASDQHMREIIEACEALSATRTGAIIVIEGNNNLSSIEQTGDTINAEISKRLLLSIFNRTSPLHDGAVLVRGTLIVAARCVLPISDDPDIPAELGMRHRAALGITEVSDAAAIVVSEENGKISVTQSGRIKRSLSSEELFSFLSNYQSQRLG